MKSFWVPYNGHSMSPLLKNSDQVLIIEDNFKKLKNGDIILFFDKLNRELILHRVISTSGVSKGDLSLISENFDEKDYVGKAIGLVRKNKYYLDFPFKNLAIMYLFTLLSKGRMRGFFLRKLSRLFMILLGLMASLYFEKSKRGHNKMHSLDYP